MTPIEEIIDICKRKKLWFRVERMYQNGSEHITKIKEITVKHNMTCRPKEKDDD
ncbi:MAG: hypothetical protein GY841_17960 [FCB group bacterium]|nr:hypothetical protein [FCB group bacterium]